MKVLVDKLPQNEEVCIFHKSIYSIAFGKQLSFCTIRNQGNYDRCCLHDKGKCPYLKEVK